LLGVRVGWLIAAEAFLFAAYAAALVVPDRTGDPRFIPAAGRVFTLLPILGIVISVLVLSSIMAGVFATRHLQRACECQRLPPWLPPVVGPGWTHFLGLISPLAIPVVIVSAWAVLLASG
jgi:hypothetical protein